jgi:30S ribosomal protein 3
MKKFVLKFLWLDRALAVSLDQVVGEKTIPLTFFFAWPCRDAWEDMRVYFDSINLVPDIEAVSFLNRITEVVNYWQETHRTEKEEKLDINKVREKFKDCIFIGYN